MGWIYSFTAKIIFNKLQTFKAWNGRPTLLEQEFSLQRVNILFYWCDVLQQREAPQWFQNVNVVLSPGNDGRLTAVDLPKPPQYQKWNKKGWTIEAHSMPFALYVYGLSKCGHVELVLCALSQYIHSVQNALVTFRTQQVINYMYMLLMWNTWQPYLWHITLHKGTPTLLKYGYTCWDSTVKHWNPPLNGGHVPWVSGIAI